MRNIKGSAVGKHPLWILFVIGVLFPFFCSAESKTNGWALFEQNLFSPDPHLQVGAMLQEGLSLSEIPTNLAPRVIARFTEMAKTNATVRGMAIVCLGNLGPLATNSLPFLEVEALDSKLSENERQVSYRAIMEIAPLSEFRLRVLEKFLRSPSDALCAAGVYSLKVTDPRWTNVTRSLPDILHTRTNSVIPQDYLILGMGKMGQGFDEVISAIRMELKSDKGRNRSSAIYALDSAKAVSEEDVVTFGKLLSDPEVSVRLASTDVLFRCGTNALPALPYLQAAAESSADRNVASRAKSIVKNLAKAAR